MEGPILTLIICTLTVQFANGFWDNSGSWLNSGFVMDGPIEHIEVNCQDPNIQNAVNQQVADFLFQNNNPSFFTTKAEEICPEFTFSWTGTVTTTPPYSILKAETERNICVERRIKEITSQSEPSWCTESTQQSSCNPWDLDFWAPCDADTIKQSYCNTKRHWNGGMTNMDRVLSNYRTYATCRGIDPSFNGVVKTEFDQFLANPANYIENDMVNRRTLENSLIWFDCFDEYLTQNDAGTTLGCDNVVTAQERQTMEQSTQWWSRQSPNNEDLKKQLKDAAISNQDARKYLCLIHYETPNTWFGRIGLGWSHDFHEFTEAVRLQLDWSPDRVNSLEVQQTMNYIENGQYAALGYPPGTADPSGREPTAEEISRYNRKFSSACKGLYDKYGPTSSSCNAYQDQLGTISSTQGNHLSWGYGPPRDPHDVFEETLKANNYDPRLALCILKSNADRNSNSHNFFSQEETTEESRTENFCWNLKDYVRDRQVNAVYQTPDCTLANQLAGVSVASLGNAMVNRDFESIDQLMNSVKTMDNVGHAMFAACLSDYIMVNLEVNCRGSYAARTNSIMTFAQEKTADASLTRKQRENAILGKLMQGSNKGDSLGRLCDQYAVIAGSTTNDDREKRARVAIGKITKTLRKLKDYNDLVTLQPNQECDNYNSPASGNVPMIEASFMGDEFGFNFDVEIPGMDIDFGMSFPFEFPLPCRQNDKHSACWKRRKCDMLNQISDQTCEAMTSLKSTVDTQWQNIVNSEATDSNFNFYTSLKTMARNVRNNIPSPFLGAWWSQNQQNQNQNSVKCAIKLMAQKLQTYWNPVDECHVMYFTRRIMTESIRPNWFGPHDNYGPPHGPMFPFDNNFNNPAPEMPNNNNGAPSAVWPFDNNPAPQQPNRNSNQPVWPFK